MKNIERILTRIESELDGLGFESQDRNNLSTALFHICIEHSKSIIFLLQQSLYASSYAMVRPLFECFVRAEWILHCASDEQITKLIKKDEFPLNFGQMLEAVEEGQGWAKTLSGIKNVAINNMHSYTHGGMQIIARRFKGGELFHAPDQGEIDETIRFVALLSILSFCQIVLISGTTEKDDVIKEIHEEICNLYLK